MSHRSQKASINKVFGLLTTGVLALAMLVVFVHSYLNQPGSISSPADTGGVPGNSLPGWLAVYFTNPDPPDALGQGIDQHILPAINAASSRIDVTSFDLNLPDLVNALVAASQRGVQVRVVYDGTSGNLELDNAATNNKTFNAIKVLKAGGISLVNGGRSNGLMHDKMIIIDGKVLFVGSWNLSYNDTYRNNNNLLKITDPSLIANYQAKFEEMFVDRRFGSVARVQVPNPSMILSGARVENYFSPEDEVTAKLLAVLRGAKKSIHFMVYTYTDEGLAGAMIDQAHAGLDVQGVIESRSADQGALPLFVCANLPVRADGNRYNMHHKVIIIDGETVVTGSFNFTRAADTSNDDNVLILHSPAVAALYEQEFQKIIGAGRTPQAAGYHCGK